MKKINGRGKKSLTTKNVASPVPAKTGKVKLAVGNVTRVEVTPTQDTTAPSNGKSKGLTARLVRKAEQLQKNLENKLHRTSG
jgi:hypothetical protein